MKILYLFDLKGQLGDAIRISKIYEKLKEYGAEVSVVNVRDFHDPRTKLFKDPLLLGRVVLRSLPHYRLGKFYPQAKLYELVAERKINECKPDGVWAEGFILPGAIADVCERHSISLVGDIHGLGSVEYGENQFLRRVHERYEFLHALEQKAIDKCQFLITVSRPMNEYLLHRGAKPEQLVCIPNGADLQPTITSYQKPFKVIYGGIFAFWEDIDSFLDMARRSSRHQFYLAGAGDLKDHVETRIRNEKIHVNYLGSVPKGQVMRLFAQMQVGIAPSVDGMTRRVACPIKVFDYLSCGLPVITPDFGEWATVVKQNRCGVVTERSTGEQFEQALEELSDRETWEEMSKNAVALIQNEWNWKRVLEPINQILNQL